MIPVPSRYHKRREYNGRILVNFLLLITGIGWFYWGVQLSRYAYNSYVDDRKAGRLADARFSLTVAIIVLMVCIAIGCGILYLWWFFAASPLITRLW